MLAPEDVASLARAAIAMRKVAEVAARTSRIGIAVKCLSHGELVALTAALTSLLTVEHRTRASALTIQAAYRRSRHVEHNTARQSLAATVLQCVWRRGCTRRALPVYRMRWATLPRSRPSLLFPTGDAYRGARQLAADGPMLPFCVSYCAARGRGLVAARDLRPGEEVLREWPTAQVLGADNDSAAATVECAIRLSN